jgi:hypothetical protein
MATSLELYVSFLRDAKFMGGIPMIVAGLALMLFGWRMWKVCVVVSFGIIGFVGVYQLFPANVQDRLWYAIGASAILAAASYYPVKASICVLGGILAAGVVNLYLQTLPLDPGVTWAASGAAFIGGTAYSALARRHVVILVTAFIGALLLLTGLAAWLLSFPGLFDSARYLAERSAIVIPFVIAVPTVMSCFYQIAEVHRVQAE